MSERDVIRGLTFREFFQHLFSKRTSLAVPGSVMWDGTDSRGDTVKDAKYNYSFTAWDERDNIAAASTGVVIVDSAGPSVDLTVESSLFSPNNDGKKDDFIITQKVTSAPEDKWEAGFRKRRRSGGEKLCLGRRRCSGQGPMERKGRRRGATRPEGLYYYFISTSDRAGNSAQSGVKEITLTRLYEIADIRTGKEHLSYIRDKELRLYPSLSNSKGLQSTASSSWTQSAIRSGR
jgi:hypothetical protein